MSGTKALPCLLRPLGSGPGPRLLGGEAETKTGLTLEGVFWAFYMRQKGVGKAMAGWLWVGGTRQIC